MSNDEVRVTFCWGRDMDTRHWWRIVMRNGEPRRAYHPEYGWKDAFRDSFVQWHFELPDDQVKNAQKSFNLVDDHGCVMCPGCEMYFTDLTTCFAGEFVCKACAPERNNSGEYKRALEAKIEGMRLERRWSHSRVKYLQRERDNLQRSYDGALDELERAHAATHVMAAQLKEQKSSKIDLMDQVRRMQDQLHEAYDEQDCLRAEVIGLRSSGITALVFKTIAMLVRRKDNG